MKAGIIAAGRGERLRAAGTLKPLVKVRGRSLIEHVLLGLVAAGATEVGIIINEASIAVRDHVEALQWPFARRWIVESTPGSMHSFLRVVETLAADGSAGPFLIATTDTVVSPHVFADFASAASADVTLAINRPAPDDNPLWVKLAPNESDVIAIGDGGEFATAGIYMVTARVLEEANAARDEGLMALRNFLVRLLERGYSTTAVKIAESVDVDHPSDIIAAEQSL